MGKQGLYLKISNEVVSAFVAERWVWVEQQISPLVRRYEMTNKKDLLLWSELRKHDEGIDEAFGWMFKGQRQPSYNRKPEILP